MARHEAHERIQRSAATQPGAGELIADPVGQIVGSLKHVKPARQVVFEMVEEYIDVTSDLASTLARRDSPQAQRCVSPMDTGEGEASERLGALGGGVIEALAADPQHPVDRRHRYGPLGRSLRQHRQHGIALLRRSEPGPVSGTPRVAPLPTISRRACCARWGQLV